ncbi:hypothetical protein SAMN02745146_1867 [Hymenobacter daecheongensis DSM 21074]|uniref:Uncharacterized protein n=1 Tax=Hymenobacter daecheongensis DSM 21074 TaxID=1121955 RepID=A0A1M6EYG7_9BACT|nr:hypothetical protein [Hymenobacter daecheongensis]SHI90518.1 hypothetical protein SAMN02745146_1867 [Hymenobacter daecheongensis DSM 21074]
MLSTVKLIETKALHLHVKVGEWMAGRAKSAVSEQARKRHDELLQDVGEIYHLAHSLRGQMPVSNVEAKLRWPKLWAFAEGQILRLKKQDPSLKQFLLQIGADAPRDARPHNQGWITYPKCIDKLLSKLGI